jgi:exodeoxyribonuclease V beta subunit
MVHATVRAAPQADAPDHDSRTRAIQATPSALEIELGESGLEKGREETPSRSGAATDGAPERDTPSFADFPAGRFAGQCMHAMFERIDFSDQTGWPAAIETALRLHPQPLSALSSSQPHADLAAMLRSAADDATSARLPMGFALCDIQARRRLTELPFWMSARGLRERTLAALLQEHGYGVPQLGFGSLDGFLNGFIDLVFEHHNRWYVLDWKSNRLGLQAQDYDASRIEDAMGEQGYHLQALIYLLALHRWLSQRLPDYRWETHMGGAVYLFVRGMQPGWAYPDGRRRGIWHHRPSQALIEALDRLVGRPAGSGNR